MENEIIQEGVELMTVGMGVVFAFLVLLVGFMYASGAFFRKFASWFSEPPVPTPPAPKRATNATAKIAVAVAAAHRRNHGA